MFALNIKYLGPTNSKGSRVKCTGFGESMTRSYDSALSARENAEAIAKEFVTMHHPKGTLVGVGNTPDNQYVALVQL